MLLAVDVGNTNIVLGVYKGDELLDTWHIATDARKMPDEYTVILLNLLQRGGFAVSDITDAVISCVAPPLITVFEELCERCFGVSPLVIGTGIRSGVRIVMDNPREVGADRIVNAAAAHHLYKGPLIVIDFGTATTLDAVSPEGDYLGGVIAPGIMISAEALFEHTAKLPRVELLRPSKAIGKNTVAAIQSGLIFGYVGLIEGIVARIKEEMGGKASVVATGGLARVIAKDTTVIDHVDPDLTLLGLRLIYDLNKQQPQRKRGEHA